MESITKYWTRHTVLLLRAAAFSIKGLNKTLYFHGALNSLHVTLIRSFFLLYFSYCKYLAVIYLLLYMCVIMLNKYVYIYFARNSVTYSNGDI